MAAQVATNVRAISGIQSYTFLPAWQHNSETVLALAYCLVPLEIQVSEVRNRPCPVVHNVKEVISL